LCLPHIIDFPCKLQIKSNPSLLSYRKFLNIPDTSIVIGRHGGKDSFNISFVYDSIMNILSKRDDVYFLFAGEIPSIFFKKLVDKTDFVDSITKEKNPKYIIGRNDIMNSNRVNSDNEITNQQDIEKKIKTMMKPLHDHIIFISPFVDDYIRIKFINTCDYMIHAFNIGESFGISVLEFDYFNKPIIMYKGNKETKYTNHFEEVKSKVLYSDEKELTDTLLELKKKMSNNTGNKNDNKFSPENVMKKFSELL
jgi:hypothetical protein